MRHDGLRSRPRGALPKHPKSVVCLPVAPGPGTQLFDPGCLVLILRQMGLNRQTCLPLYLSQSPHHRIRAGRDEPGRENGVCPLIPPLYLTNPPPCLRQGLLSFFAKPLRAVSVHIYFSHHCFQASAFHKIHEKFGGFPVPGGKDAGPGGSAGPHIFRENPIRLRRILQVLIPRLLGECPLIQPLQEFPVHAGASEGVLRRVYMQIHQPRKNQAVPPVLDGIVREPLRKFFKHPGGCSPLTDKIAMGNTLQAVLCPAGAQISPQYKIFHTHLLSPTRLAGAFPLKIPPPKGSMQVFTAVCKQKTTAAAMCFLRAAAGFRIRSL